MCVIPKFARVTTVNYHSPVFRETIQSMKERLQRADDSKEEEENDSENNNDNDNEELVSLFGGGALDMILLSKINDFSYSIYHNHPFRELMHQFDLKAWDNVDFTVLREYEEITDATDGIEKRN